MKIVVRGWGHRDNPSVPWCKDKEIQPAFFTCPAGKNVPGAGNAILTSLGLLCIGLGISRTEFPVARE